MGNWNRQVLLPLVANWFTTPITTLVGNWNVHKTMLSPILLTTHDGNWNDFIPIKHLFFITTITISMTTLDGKLKHYYILER